MREEAGEGLLLCCQPSPRPGTKSAYGLRVGKGTMVIYILLLVGFALRGFVVQYLGLKAMGLGL